MIYILLIAHFLADFTFQPAKLARQKKNNFRYLIMHSLIYAGIYLVVFLAFIRWDAIPVPYIVITGSHFLLDWARIRLEKRFMNRTVVFTSFVIDQICHVLIVIITSALLALRGQTNYIYEQMIQLNYMKEIVVYGLIFVIVWDPVAVFIKKLFSYIVNQRENSVEDSSAQIGRIIGKLERVIIVILVLCNQYGAVGFVLTAKSIARYKQLEDKDFAEKYLVGTLASAAIAFSVTIILKSHI